MPATRPRFIGRLSAALLTLLLPIGAQATPSRYSVTTIPGLDVFGPVNGALRINASGQVAGYAGYAGDNPLYFFFDGKTSHGIPNVRETSVVTLGLNDHGSVAGTGQDAAGDYRGFVYHDGSVAWIGAAGQDGVYPSAINNAGQVVGSSTLAPMYGALLDRGHVTVYPALGGAWSTADAINDAGTVAGTADRAEWASAHVWVSQDDKMVELDAPAGGSSAARDINEAGDVVGEYTLKAPFTRLPVLYHDGVMRFLPGRGGWSSADAINNHGQIVGNVETGQAALWDEGQLYLLSDLLVGPAYDYLSASDINDAGQIAGQACRGGTCQAVIFNPVSAVPEPGTWAMLAAGLLVFRLRKAKRPRYR